MDVTYRVDKEILYIAVEGRIDASNAAAAEEKIFSIKKENPGKHVVVDADKLEYISSAGLRVILRLRKEEPKLAIINVASGVYEVFDMTGFTDMVTVEKAYPRMSVEGCEFIAKGANGAVYRYDDETIIKTYFSKDALPEIKQERENARRAFILGINTAIPYGIVRVGDNYGTITELLNATSVTKLIRANPEDMTLAAKYYIDMLKTIHSIEGEDGELPDMKETALAWADFVAPHLPEDGQSTLSHSYTIAEKDGAKLYIVTVLDAWYLMNDQESVEYDTFLEAPYLEAVDAEGYSYEDGGMPSEFAAEIISWEYPEPVENDFVFAGFSIMHTGSMLATLAVGLLTIVACLIFVKRDKTVPYKILDKFSVAVNFVVSILGIPFITICVAFFQLSMSTDTVWYQLFLCVPAFAAFTVATSIALRRKGFTKTGFFVQFAGPVLFFVLTAIINYLG